MAAAHGLAHYVLHTDDIRICMAIVPCGVDWSNTRHAHKESEATELMMQLLLPTDEIHKVLQNPIDLANAMKVLSLCSHFDVSAEILGARLAQLGMVPSWGYPTIPGGLTTNKHM